MLREMVKDMLGNDIALAPKRPLQTPQREWIANDLKQFFTDKIIEFSKNDWINADEIMNIWTAYKNGNQNNSFYVWQWMNTNELLK
jgi:asparagine synthase (glutamine-hydrolysing)